LSASRQPKPSARILSTAASALPTELTLRPFMGRTLESTSTTMGSSSTTRTVSGKFITSVPDMFPPAQAPTPLYRGQAAMQVCDFAVDVRQDEGRWWQVGQRRLLAFAVRRQRRFSGESAWSGAPQKSTVRYPAPPRARRHDELLRLFRCSRSAYPQSAP